MWADFAALNPARHFEDLDAIHSSVATLILSSNSGDAVGDIGSAGQSGPPASRTSACQAWRYPRIFGAVARCSCWRAAPNMDQYAAVLGGVHYRLKSTNLLSGWMNSVLDRHKGHPTNQMRSKSKRRKSRRGARFRDVLAAKAFRLENFRSSHRARLACDASSFQISGTHCALIDEKIRSCEHGEF